MIVFFLLFIDLNSCRGQIYEKDKKIYKLFDISFIRKEACLDLSRNIPNRLYDIGLIDNYKIIRDDLEEHQIYVFSTDMDPNELPNLLDEFSDVITSYLNYSHQKQPHDTI